MGLSAFSIRNNTSAVTKPINQAPPIHLSSLREKRAGPKGLRAESARAFTGRRNSHSGRGEDFLSSQPIFFTETAVTPERKV